MEEHVVWTASWLVRSFARLRCFHLNAAAAAGIEFDSAGKDMQASGERMHCEWLNKSERVCEIWRQRDDYAPAKPLASQQQQPLQQQEPVSSFHGRRILEIIVAASALRVALKWRAHAPALSLASGRPANLQSGADEEKP